MEHKRTGNGNVLQSTPDDFTRPNQNLLHIVPQRECDNIHPNHFADQSVHLAPIPTNVLAL